MTNNHIHDHVSALEAGSRSRAGDACALRHGNMAPVVSHLLSD